ncbi:hypothetical protein [Oceanirhabdus sp. W0125-5]|uniref:hypothetical protein n=1 Tax=Oceanirhabdus sp. W0125-5 TaxID=2999116 RepID=UPI0022F2FC41|nr:hypothetical protein [Oceanirhabdus sp. W0125-5]WBW95198.1 hypothetical protein OW730_16055 [Oceanirhabdus sp. W0125-5]
MRKNKKKVMISFLIILVGAILFINNIMMVNKSGTSKADKTIDYSTYNEDMMRFELNLKSGNYKFMKSKDSPFFECSHLEEAYNKDKEFSEKSKTVYLEDTTIKYGKYLFTQNEEYIYTKIDNEFGWIKYKVPINEEYKKYIQEFFISKSSSKKVRFIIALPFNESNFVLIDEGIEDSNQYILDLKSEKITWTRGNYYESPHINFETDMLECGGDLSRTTFIFNKFGKLIEEM